MPDPKAQAATQLANIFAATGGSLEQHAQEVSDAGLTKHRAILNHFKATLGLTYGNANLLAHVVREHLAGGPATETDLLDAQYQKGKAALRPISEAILTHARALGSDVTVVVQKTAVSLRRKKQFAVVRAASSKRVELGLNLGKDTPPPSDRVTPATGMCTHRSNVTALDQVDAALVGWLQQAYDRAG